MCRRTQLPSSRGNESYVRFHISGTGVEPSLMPTSEEGPMAEACGFSSSAFCPQEEERFSNRTMARGCPFKARHLGALHFNGVQARADRLMGLSACARRHPWYLCAWCWMDQDSAWTTAQMVTAQPQKYHCPLYPAPCLSFQVNNLKGLKKDRGAMATAT